MATTDQDRHDTKDRFAVVLERLENLKSQQTGNAFDVFAAIGAKDKLVEELGAGDYFAKTSDIFPKGDALLKTIKDIRGMADKFQREAQLEDYNEQRNGFKRHLADAENQSVPDDGSVAASVASVSIRTEAKADGDPTACLVEGLPGHRGHQGSDSKNCSGWWALVYVWMIGNLAELDALLNEISGEKDSDKKKALEDRLNKSLLMLANGTKGGTAGKGMRSNDRNILFVPNPHDDYYDGGCNWIIYPIMTSGDMLVWDGKPYWVAIFCGEKLPGAGPQGKDLWVDGPSAKTAREAEAQITSKMHLKPENISVCSTTDLKIVGDGLAEMTLALADLHTRESSTSDFKAKIIDLASTIKEFLVEKATNSLDEIVEEVKKDFQGIKVPGSFEPINEQVLQLSDKWNSRKDELDAKRQNQTTFDEILQGITDLISRLQTNGIHVPVPPGKNHFGVQGKHVYKAKIRQRNSPDPIVVAAKGANNLNRQWGMRLLSGCSLPDDGDSSSAADSVSRGSPSSIKGFSAAAPVTPDRDFVGAVLVTPERLDRDVDEDDSLSTISLLGGTE